MGFFPSIISNFNLDNFHYFNNYFYSPNHLSVNNFNRIVNTIRNDYMIGGSHNNSIYYIMRGKSIVYTFLLLCGVKEEDISNIIFIELQDEYLLQFKALVPVVGYYYAKDFLLERKYNINEYPFFLQIASKMNEHNVDET